MQHTSERKTDNIEEARRLLGIARDQAYEAAKSGQIPTNKIGKRLLVPNPVLDPMLPAASTA